MLQQLGRVPTVRFRREIGLTGPRMHCCQRLAPLQTAGKFCNYFILGVDIEVDLALFRPGAACEIPFQVLVFK